MLVDAAAVRHLPRRAGRRLACVPHATTSDRSTGALLHEVAVPRMGGRLGRRTHVVDRRHLHWHAPALYSDLAVAARQQVGLITFRRWRRAVGLACEEVDAVEAHLAAFAGVHEQTFDRWVDTEPDLAVHGAVTPHLVADVRASATDVRAARAALDALVEITYGGLYAGIVSADSLRRLDELAVVTGRDAVHLAAPDGYVDCLWVDDEWGRPSDDVRSRWGLELASVNIG